MIIAKTNLKKIPEKCSKCRFKSYEGGFYESSDICAITGKELEMTFNKEKRNWMFERPKWCPLVEQ